MFFWTFALIILGAIGWFDYATGHDLHLFAFYFLPVWLLGWYVHLRSGMYMALLAAGTWFMADYTSGHVYYSPGIAGWNALMEFAACIIVAGIASIVQTQLRAQEKLNELGILYKAPSGYVMQSPWFNVANQSMETITKLSREFGLTPAARSRLMIVERNGIDLMEQALCGD